MKTTNEVTLYDLMAEDLEVYVRSNPKHGFDIEINDEYGQPLLFEDNIHEYAVDSFADFCRMFLNSYERALKQKDAA